MTEKFYYKTIDIDDYDSIISEIRKKILHDISIYPKWSGYDTISITDFLDYCPLFNNYIKNKNLVIRAIALIIIEPHRNSDIHTDYIMNEHNTYALNMGILNYEKTRTQIFSCSSDARHKLTNDKGHPYIAYDESKCSIVAEFDLMKPKLFDTSNPHRVSNNTDERRISISFRFFNNPLEIL